MYTYTYTYTYTNTCTVRPTHVQVHTHVWGHAIVCAHKHTSTHKHTHMHINTLAQIHTFMCVHLCRCLMDGWIDIYLCGCGHICSLLCNSVFDNFSVYLFFSHFGYFIFISYFLYFIKIWSGIEVELHFKPKIMKFSYSFYIWNNYLCWMEIMTKLKIEMQNILCIFSFFFKS